MCWCDLKFVTSYRMNKKNILIFSQSGEAFSIFIYSSSWQEGFILRIRSPRNRPRNSYIHLYFFLINSYFLSLLSIIDIFYLVVSIYHVAIFIGFCQGHSHVCFVEYKYNQIYSNSNNDSNKDIYVFWSLL